MAKITRDYKETVSNRLRQDSAFAAALLNEPFLFFLMVRQSLQGLY